jgi:hypothetical protein
LFFLPLLLFSRPHCAGCDPFLQLATKAMKTASPPFPAALLALCRGLTVSFVLLTTTLPFTTFAQQLAACSSAQFATDSCPSQSDGVCDADGITCPLGTDCFDCDPCHSYRFQGCDACTAAGCLWCGLDVACFSPGSYGLQSLTCNAQDFVDTCSASSSTGNAFSDPFYDAASWLFDLINIKEVWKSGISTST